jgi:raffinose/stachyose/melibiose transport system substrate-binding protein
LLKGERGKGKEAYMFRRISAVLLVFMVALSFAGAESSKTTIRFFHRWPQEPRKSYFDTLVAEFEKENPDIKIEMDSVVNDSYKEKIRVLVSSNDIPDVFFSWSDSFAYNLVQSGRIRPLNDMLARDKRFADSFISSQVKSFTFGGKIYGLPQTMDGKVFVYNKAIFSKAGITKLPANYDELLVLFDTLKKKGYSTPVLEGLGETWPIAHYLGAMFQAFIPANVLAKDYAEATGQFTDPGYKAVLQRFQKIVDYMGPNATSITHTDARGLFAEGKLPVFYVEMAEFGLIRQSNPNLKYGYFAFPPFKDGKGVSNFVEGAPEGIMMSTTCKNPAAAEKFVKFLLSKENARIFVKDIGALVAIKGAVTADNSFPELVDAAEILNKASGMTPWFDNAVNIKIADAFMRGTQSVATKDKTVDQVMSDVQAAAKIVRSEAKK